MKRKSIIQWFSICAAFLVRRWKIGNNIKALRIVFLLFSCLVISGCASIFVSKPKGTLSSQPSVTKLPLKVGVYYSPEFRSYEYVVDQGLSKFYITLGNSSVNLFDQVFSMMFENVFPVSGRPPLKETVPDLAAIIEPKIAGFDFQKPWLPFFPYEASLSYRFTFYSLDGIPFASWTVKGEGVASPRLTEIAITTMSRTTDLAMQQAATTFMQGFHEVPEIRHCLGHRSCTPNQPIVVPAQKNEAISTWRKVGTAVVSADPCVQPERQQEVFKAQLTKVGVLPIEISIQNQREKPLFVRASDIILELPNGNQIEQTGAIQVANKFQGGTSSHFSAYATLGLPGMLGSMALSDTEMAARKADYKHKSLKDVILAKDESTRGFVYFIPSASIQGFRNIQLVIKLVDTEGGSGLVVRMPFRMPLSGFEFKLP